VEESLKNLRIEALDLLQLHCPPTAVFYTPEIFEALDLMVKAGKLKNYGVSVEKVEEALKAIEYPGVRTVQIVFNIFRERPTDLLFKQAKSRWIGIIARVPLASGLLSGRMSRATRFTSDDHRAYNRKGQAFDRGETFAGVDYTRGLQAVEELRQILPRGMTMAQLALRWILMHDAVSCAIPGAKNPAQVEENCGAADAPRLSRGLMRQIQGIYDRLIREEVHQRW
jgi:aryl-alcohol dehydrogenase-like predicted oxidoreductase